MSDATETIRRQQLAEINADPSGREALEAKHGQVWDTTQLQEDFDVLGFMSRKTLRGFSNYRKV